MIHVLTDSSTGGTFLTWTLHYLAGHKNYFLLEQNAWADLPDNPLDQGNAHKFIPNQPNRIFDCSEEQFDQFAKKLNSTSTDYFHILYFHQFENKSTTSAAIRYINTQAEKLIVVDIGNNILYNCSYRKRSAIVTNNKVIIKDNKGIQDRLIDVYFSDSKKVWDQQNLHNIWDQREFLALNFRPFEYENLYSQVDKSINHYVLKGSELWTMFDFEVPSLFEYLNLGIDQQRFDHWQQIYNQWRFFHRQRLQFSTYFDTIVDSILHNYDIDLLRFDLDINQEAAIQHVLIYKHGLNLKTWQLEKFVNTKQLHNLLEPNIHSLSS